MGRARRVTLRCASEDLPSQWLVPSDLAKVQQLRDLAQKRARGEIQDSDVAGHLRQVPPLSRLGHPLIHAFDDQFSGDDDSQTLCESISAVTDRQWLKQSYSQRWRGAAILIRGDEEEIAWLGAAGYHRAGSPEDFYSKFARDCAAGSGGFLPKNEDEALLKLERKQTKFEAWKLQLHLTALILLVTALDAVERTYSAEVRTPDDKEFLTLSITVVEKEALVELKYLSWEHAKLFTTARRLVRSAIEPNPESWTATPLPGADELHATVLSETAQLHARATATSGEIQAGSVPGEVRLGIQAHYAPAGHLTHATIAGEAIRAICGYWFVPIADHEHLPHCATCDEGFNRLSR